MRILAGLCIAVCLGACANRPLATDALAGASDGRLLEERWWVNRGPDRAFKAVSREEYNDAVRDEILRRCAHWPAETTDAIREGRVELGMSMPQVATAIGWPTEYPWWGTHFRPIGMDGDDLAYHDALAARNRWTFRYGGDYLKVWFRDGAVYRIMDDRTGRIETTD